MKIVFTDFIDIPADQKRRFIDMGVTIYDDVPADEAAIIRRIKGAEIITANYTAITSKIIDAAPHLKYIIVPAVGYDWVDCKYAATKGIKVINCPAYNARAVAEHAMALLFATARRICEANTLLRAGEWQPAKLRGFELSGKKLGIVGYGNIGKHIEALGKGLGMDTQFVNSTSTADQLDTLLASSDVVILCLPLTEKTNHLLDTRRLALLKPDAVLINVARGEIVDQSALIAALKDGSIKAAGLDVFINEPLIGSPSNEIITIANMPNVVATPHMAYNTVESSERLGETLLKNIVACLRGEPINIVN